MDVNTAEPYVLSELKEYLYKEKCPVVIKSGSLTMNPESNCVTARMTVKNIGDRTVTSVLADIHIFDVANNEIEVIRDHQFFGLNALRDDEFGGDTEINIISSKGNTFSVAVRNVTFDDDTVWEGTASLFYESIPPRRTLLAELEDQETVDQYRRDFSQELAEDKEVTAEFVPAVYKDLWLCSCGEINHMDEEKCYRCGARLDPQGDMLDNRVQIAANLTAYKKAMAEKAEAERLAAEKKAADAAAAKAEAERLAAEEKARLELKAKRKARNKKIFLAVSIPTLIAAIIFVIVLITYIIPSNKYGSAKLLLEGGKYDEAVTVFASLNGFGDSTQMVSESKYQKALSTVKDKNYDEAISLFKEIIKYNDSAEQISGAKYLKAEELFAGKKYDEAIALFEEIPDYSDSAARLSGCYFEKAKADIDNIDTAKVSFDKLSDSDSVKMQQIFCDKGKELYNGGNEEQALMYFALVSDKTILEQIDAIYYDGALKLIDGGELDKALDILNKLGTYSDSTNQILRIYYLKAEKLRNDGNNTEAISYYEQSNGFEDSAEKIKLCNYNIAVASLNSGAYGTAKEQFNALGDYSDSASLALEAQYQYGVQLLGNGDVVKSYEVLYAIKDYSKAYALLVSNSQFYIYVYDVGVGPNPLNQ